MPTSSSSSVSSTQSTMDAITLAYTPNSFKCTHSNGMEKRKKIFTEWWTARIFVPFFWPMRCGQTVSSSAKIQRQHFQLKIKWRTVLNAHCTGIQWPPLHYLELLVCSAQAHQYFNLIEDFSFQYYVYIINRMLQAWKVTMNSTTTEAVHRIIYFNIFIHFTTPSICWIEPYLADELNRSWTIKHLPHIYFAWCGSPPPNLVTDPNLKLSFCHWFNKFVEKKPFLCREAMRQLEFFHFTSELTLRAHSHRDVCVQCT